MTSSSLIISCNDPILQIFQMRSYSKILGVRTSSYFFEDHDSTVIPDIFYICFLSYSMVYQGQGSWSVLPRYRQQGTIVCKGCINVIKMTKGSFAFCYLLVPAVLNTSMNKISTFTKSCLLVLNNCCVW